MSSNSLQTDPEFVARFRGSRPRNAAFSILEVTVVAGLTGFLFVMISGIWAGLGRSMADGIAQAKIVSEAGMALQTIRRDLGGMLPGSELGPRDEGRLVGRMVVGGSQLRLCYDGGSLNGSPSWSAPDTVIRYEVQNGQLLRVDQTAGTTFVIASYVEDFRVTQLANSTRIELDLAFGDFNRRYRLEVQQP